MFLSRLKSRGMCIQMAGIGLEYEWIIYDNMGRREIVAAEAGR